MGPTSCPSDVLLAGEAVRLSKAYSSFLLLMHYVFFRLEKLIASFLEDQDPESRLEVGADMRKIHHCFHHFKVNFNVSSSLGHVLPCSNCNKNSSWWPTLETPGPSLTRAENSPSVSPGCDYYWAAAGIVSNFSTNKPWPQTSDSFARSLSVLCPEYVYAETHKCEHTHEHKNVHTHIFKQFQDNCLQGFFFPSILIYLNNLLTFLSLWSLAFVISGWECHQFPLVILHTLRRYCEMMEHFVPFSCGDINNHLFSTNRSKKWFCQAYLSKPMSLLRLQALVTLRNVSLKSPSPARRWLGNCIG